MEERDVLDALRASGAVLEGHFLLSSGRHSDVYVEKFRVLERPRLAAALGASLAARLSGRGASVVVSPAVGGIVMGFATALALDVRFVFAEREAGEMRLRRGFAVNPAERVVVIDDVVTTGRSLREALALVAPGELAGIGCLLDRSGGIELPLPLESLARMDPATWPPEECPRCAAGGGPVSPGSRHLAPPRGR